MNGFSGMATDRDEPVTEGLAKTEEVFGIVRGRPLNYVERERVDSVFFESLSRDKHIVVYGSSKQGKTSLRKTWLGDEDYLHVGCLNSMSLAELHGALLKKAGYRIEQSASKSVSGSHKFTVEFGGKGKIPFIAEGEAKGGYEGERTSENQETTKRLEIDLADVNDVVTALKEAKSPRYLVLEDFHYLPIETQQNFSMVLKLFHEESDFCFIVIGVWREKNRLIYFNGDLASRVVAIDADEWRDEELNEVMQAGEKLLNIQFDEKFRADVVTNAQHAVYLIQECCLKACHESSVYSTQDVLKNIGADIDAQHLIKSIVDEQAGRYIAFIRNVSEGFQRTDLEMYKWLMYAVLNFSPDELGAGILRSDMASAIKAYHPDGDGLNEGNITQALTSVASLQVKKGVRPIILDYDQTHRVLNVVDRAFLIWLSHQDRDALLREIS